MQNLLSHYAMEIDTLLMMDDAISNFRGNDIMKTLTIFTALFMPATVIGAVWGMNFERIPWAGERWGFITVSAIIVVTTLLIYWWLWHKGWTGDLLNGRSDRRHRQRVAVGGLRRGPDRFAAGGTSCCRPGTVGAHADGGLGQDSADAPEDDSPAPLPSRSSR